MFDSDTDAAAGAAAAAASPRVLFYASAQLLW